MLRYRLLENVLKLLQDTECTEHTLDALLEMLVCPITLEVTSHVYVIHDGSAYEREVINQWFWLNPETKKLAQLHKTLEPPRLQTGDPRPQTW